MDIPSGCKNCLHSEVSRQDQPCCDCYLLSKFSKVILYTEDETFELTSKLFYYFDVSTEFAYRWFENNKKK